MEEQNTNNINLDTTRVTNEDINNFINLTLDGKRDFLYDQLIQNEISCLLISNCIDLALNTDKIIPQDNNFTDKERRYYRNDFAYNLFKNVLNNPSTNKSTIITLLNRLIIHKYPIVFKNLLGFSFNKRFKELVNLALKHNSIDPATITQIQDRIKNAKKNYIKRIFLENLEHAGERMINFINRLHQI